MAVAAPTGFGYNPILTSHSLRIQWFQHMNKNQNFYHTLPDGTLKHIHPLGGTEVWTVPSRAHRPIRRPSAPVQLLKPVKKENYCDFCPSAYLKTPPEKSRLVQTKNRAYKKIDRLKPDLYETSRAVFRRVANLFEIVTLDYWVKNHALKPSLAQLRLKKGYLESPTGRAHALKIVDVKLALSGYSPDDLSRLGEKQRLAVADAFFFGSHDLIIAGRHYIPNARTDNQYYSSGEMSPEEHVQFFRFTLEALADLYAQNPKIQYISVFQNWLQPAGASLNHLHKQLVGMDEWGPSIQNELQIVEKNPNIYNDLILNFSRDHHLILAENEHAVAICELGHRYPTLAVYSKSAQSKPEKHSAEELKDFSDLVHACHAATGSQIPCNEEWYYSPPNSKRAIPWHVLIKWRTINQAGFEGATKIYINPLSPRALLSQMAPKLFELRKKGKIGKIRIADECQTKTSPLRYYRAKSK
jgi:galactose-1-phosphate uridylyltransferase